MKKAFFSLIIIIFFFSCTEKKKQTERMEDSTGVVVPEPAKVEICIHGELPSVLDTIAFPPIVKKKRDSRTELYLLPNKDSLTVKFGTCESPSYEYTYSTARYNRGPEELKFYYGAVSSFYLMMGKQHNAVSYLHDDVISASKLYLLQNKWVELNHPIPFSSQGRKWTYTFEELRMEGQRRVLVWSVK